MAETNAPKRPEEGKGMKGAAMKMMMKKAGAAVPTANRITLLRDADGDGTAETRTVFLQDLNSPFGMALVGDKFYVANSAAVVRFLYKTGVAQITAAPQKVADLPAGPRNHHWTKSLVASHDGEKLYVGVGSNRAPTAMSPSTASRRRRSVRRSSKSTPPRVKGMRRGHV